MHWAKYFPQQNNPYINKSDIDPTTTLRELFVCTQAGEREDSTGDTGGSPTGTGETQERRRGEEGKNGGLRYAMVHVSDLLVQFVAHVYLLLFSVLFLTGNRKLIVRWRDYLRAIGNMER